MQTKEELLKRSNECELCKQSENLDIYEVTPKDEAILICSTCKENLSDLSKNTNHWHCLNESIWSEIPAVQVISYRTLSGLKNEGFARDLLDMAYLEDDVLKWAKEGLEDENASPTHDSNGVTLNSGDSVTIIKDLDVKGAGFTAKRGTIVKNISLTDNPTQIEGRVNGVKIVLLSKFLKKA